MNRLATALQARARWGAHHVDIMAIELNALGNQFIDGGGLEVRGRSVGLGAMITSVRPAKVVHNNQENIREIPNIFRQG